MSNASDLVSNMGPFVNDAVVAIKDDDTSWLVHGHRKEAITTERCDVDHVCARFDMNPPRGVSCLGV